MSESTPPEFESALLEQPREIRDRAKRASNELAQVAPRPQFWQRVFLRFGSRKPDDTGGSKPQRSRSPVDRLQLIAKPGIQAHKVLCALDAELTEASPVAAAGSEEGAIDPAATQVVTMWNEAGAACRRLQRHVGTWQEEVSGILTALEESFGGLLDQVETLGSSIETCIQELGDEQSKLDAPLLRIKALRRGAKPSQEHDSAAAELDSIERDISERLDAYRRAMEPINVLRGDFGSRIEALGELKTWLAESPGTVDELQSALVSPGEESPGAVEELHSALVSPLTSRIEGHVSQIERLRVWSTLLVDSPALVGAVARLQALVPSSTGGGE